MHWWTWLLIALAAYAAISLWASSLLLPITVWEIQLKQWRLGWLWPVILVLALAIPVLHLFGIGESKDRYPYGRGLRLWWQENKAGVFLLLMTGILVVGLLLFINRT